MTHLGADKPAPVTERAIPLCTQCKQRPGTEQWIGEGGVLALSHGFYQWWCPVCVLRAQIDYARGRAAALPEMETRLAALLAAEQDASAPAVD